MRFFTALLFCLACASAQAVPIDSSGDALDKLFADKGVINRLGDQIQQAGQNVGEKANDLVETAMGFLGVRYKRGGNTAETGFDCSGFVRAIYEQSFGLILPRSAGEQAKATQKIDRDDLKPGDLVFFNTMRRAFSHVGIYLGDKRFVHAPSTGGQVRIDDMSARYWLARFEGARRLPAEPQL